MNGQLYFHDEPLSTAFHSATVPSKVTEVSEVQSQKALLPMLVTLSGIVIEVREVQSQKA